MSLINDALKQARQVPPRQAPNLVPPLRPVAEESSPDWGRLGWLFILVLFVAGVFFMGWSVAHRRIHKAAVQPKAVVATPVTAPAAAPGSGPAAAAPAVSPAAAPMPAPMAAAAAVAAPAGPVLQGIFYSPTAPSAIINGKTVRPGSHLDQYLVKDIGKSTVTLVGPDKKEIQLGMNH